MQERQLVYSYAVPGVPMNHAHALNIQMHAKSKNGSLCSCLCHALVLCMHTVFILPVSVEKRNMEHKFHSADE